MDSSQKLGNYSPHQSDSDGWTLVSPPHSSSDYSPKREDLSIESNQSSSDSSLNLPDGLTEIDLKQQDSDSKVASKISGESLAGRSSAELIERGFQALDTTDEDEVNNSGESRESRRSSLTHSELAEYVDLGARMNSSLVAVKSAEANEQAETLENDDEDDVIDYDDDDGDIDSQDSSEHLNSNTELEKYDKFLSQNDDLLCIKANLDDLCDVVTNKQRKLVINDAGELYLKRGDTATTLRRADSDRPNHLYSIPISSQDHVELHLLDSQLTDCIKRQSPASFKYYISEDRFKETTRTKSTKDQPRKSTRGLVCYGQETYWRNRIDKLKLEHNIDIRDIIRDAKKQFAIDTLESRHPLSKFKLIINQIEYLDFIENKRIKKQTEETIKFLKAENLQLLHRLNQPSDSEFQKLLVDLELENSRLQRENAALKANLLKKAGPTYIKQSNELERYERENVILKQFHYQVAQEVSKSLKQFNVYTVDASPILDSQESLISQLMLTRGYLRKLSEKVGTVLIENDGLKEELKENYLSSLTKSDVELSRTNELDAYVEDLGQNNNSNALSVDTCMHNLRKERNKSHRLETEVERLKQDCSKRVNVGLERGSDRQINVTKQEANMSENWIPLLGSVSQRQLDGVTPKTGLDKRMTDHLSIRNDDIMDELMVFLTKFNAKLESNEVAIVDNQEYSTKLRQQLPDSKHQQKETKVIPNYIREASRIADYDLTSEQTEELASDISGERFLMNLVPHVGEQLILSRQANRSLHDADLDEENLKVKESTNDKTTNQQTISTDEVDLKVTSKAGILLNQSTENIDMHLANARDTWFFKRAKQRKQLRHNNKQQEAISLKRAKLREKLRKANSFIDDHYLAFKSNVKGKNVYDHKRKEALSSKDHKKCKSTNSGSNRCKYNNNAKQAKQQPEPPYRYGRYSSAL